MTAAAAPCPREEQPPRRRRFAVQFTHRCALSLPRVLVQVADVVQLPERILAALSSIPTIPGTRSRDRVYRQVSVDAAATGGRVVVGYRTYPFVLAEVTPDPDPRCATCGDAYDEPPECLREFVVAGLCWRCV